MAVGEQSSSAAPHQSDEGGGERMNSTSPFKVLGIALVVDKRGKGASMVMRYPTAPLTTVSEDIFFRLPPRQMSKLFRPKDALCEKPMTLSVGGTVFCCWAVLMDDSGTIPNCNNSEDGMSDDGSHADDDLVLFSVIVALSPHVQLSSIPIAGWFEGHSHDYPDFHPNIQQDETEQEEEQEKNKASSSSSRVRQASPSFLSVQRVHITLARLCRVLEREERRCRYVSEQTRLFQTTLNELKTKWERARRDSDNTGVLTSATPGGSSAGTSPASITSKTTTKGPGRHRRAHSFSLYERNNAGGSGGATAKRGSVSSEDVSFQNSEAFQQEYLDIIMAASSPTAVEGYDDDDDDGDDVDDDSSHDWQNHQGNLARELVQVYHALARNDIDFPPTTFASLWDRNGVVFINRHLTTAIEAVSPLHRLAPSRRSEDGPFVQPYETLLFPHASADQLLESLVSSSSSSGSPRRLEQFLYAVHPQKSVSETAMEANLPLQAAMDLANFLVEQGACVAASVLSRNSHLACRSTSLIPTVSLSFNQAFGDALQVFHLVAYLTEGNRTLGNAMTAWKTSESDQWLRERLEACPLPRERAEMSYLGGGGVDDPETDRHLSALEELLYQMTIWLYSHKVLVQLEEYLVTTTPPSAGSFTIREDESTVGLDNGERKVDSNVRLDRLNNESLYKELLHSGCLEGRSLKVCSWQTGIDLHRLRTFALQHPLIRLVVRAPDGLDD